MSNVLKMPTRDEIGSVSVEERAEFLAGRYAYWPQRNRAIDISCFDPEKAAIPMGQLRRNNARWSQPRARGELPPAVKPGLINPVDLWVASSACTIVGAAEYRPDRPSPLFVDGGGAVKNMYDPPRHSGPAEGAVAVAPFLDFVDQLVRDSRARKWMLDMMASQAQDPANPTTAVFLITPADDTGTDTLFDILVKLAGDRNAAVLRPRRIFGTARNSAHWGDWGAQVLTCVATLPGAGETTAQEKARMHAILRSVVDTRPRTMLLSRRRHAEISVSLCNSLWMVGHTREALPLLEFDRRASTLLCRGLRSDDSVLRVTRWAEDPRNIAALHAWLLKRDLRGFDPTAPRTRGITPGEWRAGRPAQRAA